MTKVNTNRMLYSSVVSFLCCGLQAIAYAATTHAQTTAAYIAQQAALALPDPRGASEIVETCKFHIQSRPYQVDIPRVTVVVGKGYVSPKIPSVLSWSNPQPSFHLQTRDRNKTTTHALFHVNDVAVDVFKFRTFKFSQPLTADQVLNLQVQVEGKSERNLSETEKALIAQLSLAKTGYQVTIWDLISPESGEFPGWGAPQHFNIEFSSFKDSAGKRIFAMAQINFGHLDNIAPHNPILKFCE